MEEKKCGVGSLQGLGCRPQTYQGKHWEVSNVTLAFLGSVMLGIFVLGLLSYRATATGAIAGLIGVGSVVLFGYIVSCLTPGANRTHTWDYVIWSQWRRRPAEPSTQSTE